MKLHDLAPFPLVYLATPYSKYPHGIALAFREAARLAARLMVGGVRVYSPIVHTHPMAVYGKISPLAHEIWLPFDEAIMSKADALLVARLESWKASKGIAYEIDFFNRENKPIFYINPETLEVDNGRQDGRDSAGAEQDARIV